MAGKASGIRAGRAFIELFAEDSKLRAGLKAAEAKLQAFGKGIASVGSIAAGLGVAIGTPLLGAAKLFADTGSELADMSARTGMSVEALSALGHAATQTGTDLATVEGAARKLQKNIVAAATGSQEMEAAFLAIGLSSQRLLRLSPDEQFAALADAIARLPNPTAKTAAAMTLLGKSGAALIPMIDDLGSLTDEARSLGLVMSADTAEAADRLGDAMDIVVKVVKQAAIQVGAALAPALTRVAGVITDLGVQAVAWIKANQSLVVTIAQVAVGLVAAGSAAVALGVAVAGLGAALGVLSTAIGAVGAVLGFLLSPIGMITAALAAGVVAFVQYTNVGGQAMTWLGEQFAALGAMASQTFRGMADALMAGDLMLAAKVLWAGLKVAWLTGTNYLQQVWSDWGLAVRQVVADLQTSIAGVFLDISSAVQIIWYDLTSSLTGTWGDMIGDFIKALIPLKDVFKALGVDLGASIDESLKTLGFSVTDPNQRQATRDAAVAQIGQENIDARAALASGADSETEKRRQAARDALAKSAAELEAAQAEFAGLTGEADNLRRVMEASTKGVAGGKAFDPGEIDTAITDAKAKIDVAGSFNAAAFRGLGVGSSLQDDQLKESKKQSKSLERIEKNTDRQYGIATA